jgi:hypothetical protein
MGKESRPAVLLDRFVWVGAYSAIICQAVCYNGQSGMKVYFEHGALNRALRSLQRAGKITLIHFPYDPDSRSNPISAIAMPSAAQYRDLNVRYDELGHCRYDDFVGSPMLSKIREIIGRENRRDALHVDSAYKSGCRAFVTQDRDILDRARELGLSSAFDSSTQIVPTTSSLGFPPSRTPGSSPPRGFYSRDLNPVTRDSPRRSGPTGNRTSPARMTPKLNKPLQSRWSQGFPRIPPMSSGAAKSGRNRPKEGRKP